jgi:hypothetical protein
LDNAGYGFQNKTPVIIPPYSEQVVKCKTLEKGVRFIEHQILQPGLICAASLVSCETSGFPCLVINLTYMPVCMVTDPILEKPPTMMNRPEAKSQTNRIKRLKLLNESLRLNHIIEGADEIRDLRGICGHIQITRGSANCHNSNGTHDPNPLHTKR